MFSSTAKVSGDNDDGDGHFISTSDKVIDDTISSGNTMNKNFIDLSSFYDNLSELYADQADDGTLNQSNAADTKGRAIDYSDNS